MAKYVAESRYIASIYPGKLDPQTKFHGDSTDPRRGRCKRYWLPQIVRGGKKPVIPMDAGCTPTKHRMDRDGNVVCSCVKNVTLNRIGSRWVAVLEITDAFESVPNPLKSDLRGGRMHFDLSPVSCDEISTNLLRDWAGNFVDTPPGAAPGIMLINGTVPTEAELQQMIDQQQMFYEYRLMQGDKAVREGNWKELTQEMRDAVVYLGRKRDWAGDSGTVDCPHCFQQIPIAASVCYHCQKEVKPRKELMEQEEPAAV